MAALACGARSRVRGGEIPRSTRAHVHLDKVVGPVTVVLLPQQRCVVVAPVVTETIHLGNHLRLSVRGEPSIETHPIDKSPPTITQAAASRVR